MSNKERSAAPNRVSFYGAKGGVGTTSLAIAFANAVAERLQVDVLVRECGPAPAGAESVVPNRRVTVTATACDESRYGLVVSDHGSTPDLRAGQGSGEGEALVNVSRDDDLKQSSIDVQPRHTYDVRHAWVSVREPVLARLDSPAYLRRISAAVDAHFEELAGALADKLGYVA